MSKTKFCLENHLPTDPRRLPPAPIYPRGSHPCRRRDVSNAIQIVVLGEVEEYTAWYATETVEGPWMPTAQLYPGAGKVYTIDA